LYIAAFNGNFKIVKYLLNEGADINEGDVSKYKKKNNFIFK
jgi:ankyrin repeat protein